MSYAQVTTSNSRERPQTTTKTTANDHKNDRKRPQKRPQTTAKTTANDHKNDHKRPQTTANDHKRPQKRPQTTAKTTAKTTANDRKRPQTTAITTANDCNNDWNMIALMLQILLHLFGL